MFISYKIKIAKLFITFFAMGVLVGCGDSNNSSSSNSSSEQATLLSPGTLSLGNPDTRNFDTGRSVSSRALAEEQSTTSIAAPTIEERTQVRQDELDRDFEEVLSEFQDDGFSYSALLENGIVSDPSVRANPGHLAFGVVYRLWLDDLDVRRRLYSASDNENRQDLGNNRFSVLSVFSDSTTNSEITDFIGWDTATTGQLTVRAVYREGNERSLQRSVVESTITQTNTEIKSARFTPFGNQTVITGSRDSDGAIVAAARMIRTGTGYAGWDTNLGAASNTGTNGGDNSIDGTHIALQFRIEAAGQVRVDWAQCAMTSATCTIASGPSTGTNYYTLSDVDSVAGYRTSLDTTNAADTPNNASAPTMEAPGLPFGTDVDVDDPEALLEENSTFSNTFRLRF